MNDIFSNVLHFSETAPKKYLKKYNDYDQKYHTESKRIHRLEQAYQKALDKQNKAVIAMQQVEPVQYHYVTKKTNGKGTKKTERVKVADKQATGMTKSQEAAFFKQSKFYHPLTSARRRLKHYKLKMKEYRYAKKDLILMRRQNTIINAKLALSTPDANGLQMNNSYIICNDARSDDSYVVMQVQTQSDEHSTNVASQPIEHDMNVVTTTQMSAPQISISAKIGIDVDSLDWNGNDDDDVTTELVRQINRLQKWSHQGTDMYWGGPHTYEHCVISTVSTNYNWAADGSITTVDVSLTLTVANYFDSEAKAKKGKAKHTGDKGRTRGRSSKKKDAKHYIIAKSGMTYDYIAEKKGVSVQSLEQQNSYPARKIPIGSKIYY